MPSVENVTSEVPVCEFMKSFHLTMPELQEDAYPFFARLRSECPAAHSELAGGFHVFSKYEDVTFILQHPETFSNSQTSIPAAPKPLGPSIPTQIDPPDLQKYRQLLTAALGPGAIKAFEPAVRATARRLLEPIAANRKCDFLRDFAVPLPCETFCTLLGIPAEGLTQFLEWKDLLIKAGVSTSDELRAKSRETRVLVEQYLRDIYEERAAAGDPGDDLMGVLMTARFGGERPLSIDEMVNYTELLFSAGLDTVTSQLSLAIVYLATHPDRRDELVNDPSIVPAAVDELIRYDTLVGVGRKVIRDVEIRGVQLHPGDMVMVLMQSADRDEDQFPNADEVDFHRPSNRHLGFGIGPHRCLGSHLARMEMIVALEEIHRMIPTYRIDDTVPVMRHLGYVQGIDQLQLTLD